MNTQAIEQRSLAPAKWANLFMGVAGVTAAIISNADALMLDGLFSGVNFLAAIFAARVASSVQRPADATRPFGYDIDEPVYIMFRSLVLTGIIIVALFNALNKIATYASGGRLDEIKLGPIVGYMIMMLVICFSLAAWHHYNWRKTERQSDLLKAEYSAAIIDGVLSAAAGSAFVAIAFLKNTSLSFLVPISDAIVVTGLALYMIPKPIRMFTQAIKEVVGASVEQELLARFRDTVAESFEKRPFTLLELAATKTGRSMFVFACIRPEQASTADQLDEIREVMQRACEGVSAQVKSDIFFTGKQPF